MSTTVLFYTNNLLPRKLLFNTMDSIISMCVENNFELIVTSHFPLFENYQVIDIGDYIQDEPYKKHPFQDQVNNYIVRDIFFKNHYKNHYELITNYVCGPLNYSYKSIAKQILFSLMKCSGDKVIFSEHDCFYPHDYFKVMSDRIDFHDVCYCVKKRAFLNRDGFYSLRNLVVYLSGVGGKKDFLKKCYETKLNNLNNKDEHLLLEPIIKGNLPVPSILPIQDKTTSEKEIFVEDYEFIDDYLTDDQCILDIKHDLNATGNLVSGNGSNLATHPYWGNSERLIDMIQMTNMNATLKKTLSYGIVNYR